MRLETALVEQVAGVAPFLLLAGLLVAGMPAPAQTEAPPEEERSGGGERLNVQTMCTNCNEADIDLCGLGDSHIDVRCDGFPLYGGLPRIYALSIMPPESIVKTEVVTGPRSAEHSYQAIAGSVEMTSRDPRDEPRLQVSGEAGSYGWRELSMLGDGRWGPLSGRLALTRSRTNEIDANGDGNVETGEIEQWTGFGELVFDLGAAGRIIAGATRIEDDQLDGHGQVELDPATLDPIGYLDEDTFVDWQRYHLGYDLDLAAGHSLRVRALQSDRNQRIVAPAGTSAAPPTERYAIDQRIGHVDLRYKGFFGYRWKLSAGLSAEEDDVSVEGQALPSTQRRAKELIQGWGGFVQAETSLGPRLSCTVGTRYDEFELDSGTVTAVFPETGEQRLLEPITRSKWSPRTAVTWKPRPSVTVEASLGYGFTPPRPIFTEICCGQSPETNAGIEPERSRTWALDLSYQPSPVLTLNLYGHLTDFENHIVKMVAGSVGLEQKLKQGNLPEASIEGLSGYLSWSPDRSFDVSVSYTALDATNDGDSITLLARPFGPVDAVVPVTLPLEQIPYLAERSGRIALAYRHPRLPLSVNVAAEYTGPMLIQQYENVPFAPLPPAGLREDYRETEEFWVVNLAGTYDVTERVGVQIGVDNVLGYVQSDLDDFTTDYNWGPIRDQYAYAGLTYRY